MAIPRIPGVGGDPRERAQTTDPAGKIWFRDLDEAVIEADRCIQCGTCVTACPSNSIGVDEIENRPTLVRMCTGCSRCWDFCPRSGMRYERIGTLVEAESDKYGGFYTARAQDTSVQEAGQDGGVVTALLASLLEEEILDGALVARQNPAAPLEGESYLATSPSDLRANAGSLYTQPMQLGHLHALLEEAGLGPDAEIALVGTPCVIEGAAALARFDWAGEVDPIGLTIALMCTRSFEHDRLESLLSAFVDPAEIDRLDVTGGILYAYDDKGVEMLAEPVEHFDSAALRGCLECADFEGAAADITVGSIGSPDAHTTVIVRTERGELAWAVAEDELSVEDFAGQQALERIVSWNKQRAQAALEREYDTSGSIGISYEEHRKAYDNTDREPKPLNPARVHQYEEWC